MARPSQACRLRVARVVSSRSDWQIEGCVSIEATQRARRAPGGVRGAHVRVAVNIREGTVLCACDARRSVGPPWPPARRRPRAQPGRMGQLGAATRCCPGACRGVPTLCAASPAAASQGAGFDLASSQRCNVQLATRRCRAAPGHAFARGPVAACTRPDLAPWAHASVRRGAGKPPTLVVSSY